jgi:hypothetical protein
MKMNSLKDQLNFIGLNFDSKINKIERGKDLPERLETKQKELESINDKSNRVVIDACGRSFETTKTTILNCAYENLLTKEAAKEGDVRVHIDIPRNYFKHILAMLRYFCKTDEDVSERETYVVELDEKKDNLVNFKTCVNLFFPDLDIVKRIKIIKVKPKTKFR